MDNRMRHTAIFRFGILLALVALEASAATAQTDFSFAAGVDSTGWAQAQSNADGHVLIESQQYPYGLWLHLFDETGDALAGIQVEYQGRPDSLVAIRCVDPTGSVRETLVWSRPEGDPLRLTLKPRESTDLPAGLAPIDWQIDSTAVSLLEPVAETRLESWEALAAFLQKRWQRQTKRVVVQIQSSTPVINVAVERSRGIETLVEHLQQTYWPTGTSLEKNIALYVQVFRVGLASLQEGVIFYLPLFADANLERVVREALGQPQGRFTSLTSEDVASLTRLSALSKDIHSLTDIEYLTALRWLNLHGNRIVDVTSLSSLTQLEKLSLSGNQIVDVSPLNQLTQLEELKLYRNRIVDVTPLSSLTQLKLLWLQGNQIIDVTPLSSLTQLETLLLSHNQIVDVTPLSSLTQLKSLTLSDNQIIDVTPLSSLTQLKSLTLDDNERVDLTLLSSLIQLETLLLSDNQIIDVTPLSSLTQLETLFLSRNQIVDVTPLSSLTQLETLRLQGNQIIDVTPLSSLTQVKWLYLYGNQIVDLTPLNQLTQLEALSLASNRIADVTPLSSLTQLKLLWLYGNQIVDLTPLNQLTRLETLSLSDNQIVDVSPLAKLGNLRVLRLDNNQIEDLAPLVANTGLGEGDEVRLSGNPLSTQALTEHIPALQARDVEVIY